MLILGWHQVFKHTKNLNCNQNFLSIENGIIFSFNTKTENKSNKRKILKNNKKKT